MQCCPVLCALQCARPRQIDCARASAPDVAGKPHVLCRRLLARVSFVCRISTGCRRRMTSVCATAVALDRGESKDESQWVKWLGMKIDRVSFSSSGTVRTSLHAGSRRADNGSTLARLVGPTVHRLLMGLNQIAVCFRILPASFLDT